MILHDEQGKLSTSRVLLFGTVVFAFIVVVAHVWFGKQVDNAVWSLMAGMVLAFTGWAGGPRVAQYLLPQIGAVTQAVGQAVKRKYGTSTEAHDNLP